jgi:hypothetical protein
MRTCRYCGQVGHPGAIGTHESRCGDKEDHLFSPEAWPEPSPLYASRPVAMAESKPEVQVSRLTAAVERQ